MRRTVTCAAFVLWSLHATAFAQCAKDTDCKGDRICVDGKCVAPEATPTATPDGCAAKRAAEAAANVALRECLGTGKGCESEFANRSAAVEAAKGCPEVASPGATPTPTAVPAATPVLVPSPPDPTAHWRKKPGSLTGGAWVGYAARSFTPALPGSKSLTGNGLQLGVHGGVNVFKANAVVLLVAASEGEVETDLSAEDAHVHLGIVQRGALGGIPVMITVGGGYSRVLFQSTGSSTVLNGFGYGTDFELIFRQYFVFGIHLKFAAVNSGEPDGLNARAIGASIGLTY